MVAAVRGIREGRCDRSHRTARKADRERRQLHDLDPPDHREQELTMTVIAILRYMEGSASLVGRWRINCRRFIHYTAEEILRVAQQGNVLIKGWGAATLHHHARVHEPDRRPARRAGVDIDVVRQEALMSFMTHLALVLTLLAALCAPARAADYEVGTNLLCDTRQQAERFVALFNGDAEAAVVAVNAEEQDPTACVLMNVTYLRGSQIAMARHGDNAFEIVRILVVGIATETGVKPVRPAAYFSLFGVKEYSI
jgi:hypothetical protein